MTTAFKCFLPSMLVDIIRCNVIRGQEYIEPLSIFMNGVCLVVDISGFTRLSGEFCGMGKSGIDQLQLATNGFMGQLVGIIQSYGGEIIKFAGDAIICLFPCRLMYGASLSRVERTNSNVSEPSEGVSLGASTPTAPVAPLTADPIITAMLCAEKLRTVETDKLTAHIAIGCGEMCFGVLGGFDNQWECLISGPCIQDLSACLDDAGKREIVLSGGCANTLLGFISHRKEDNGISCAEYHSADLSCQFTLSGLSSGNQKVASLQSDTDNVVITVPVIANAPSIRADLEHKVLDVVKLFVPRPIAAKLENDAELSYLAEIRQVTTMFMKVSCLLHVKVITLTGANYGHVVVQWDSYDPSSKHRDLLKLQTQLYEVQKVLHTTGAYLRQFLVDDKGCVLIACWGMPNMSYLDNTHRALSAAAQIRCKMLAMDMTCSFGITTGDVYCGTVGSALRMEYAAVGSVVNMSARLMCKAHGGILIDEATYGSLTADVRCLLTALEPIKVKGRDEPLPVFSYIAGSTPKIQEKVIEDHAIPLAKRSVMLDFLDSMLEKEDQRSPSDSRPATLASRIHSPPQQPQNWLWSLFRRDGSFKSDESPPPSLTAEPSGGCAVPLQVLLIKGLEGSGKTSLVKWLRKQAQDRAIPVHCVRVSPRESTSSYLVWRRLFTALVPKELFLSADAQRAFFVNMLRQIYPGISRSMRKVKFSVLRTALGVTSTFTKGEATHIRSDWLAPLSPKSSAPASGSESEKLIAHSVVQETVRDVMAYLMNDVTSLLVVENVENADEASLQVLCSLLKVQTRSAIVLTAVKQVVDDPLTLSRVRTRAVRQDALHSTFWATKYKCIVQCHAHTRTLFLEQFRLTDVERMVAEALQLDNPPSEVTLLVYEYAGGSCFWVLELLQFIKEHGAERFKAAITEDATAEAMQYDAPVTGPERRRSSFDRMTSANFTRKDTVPTLQAAPTRSGSAISSDTVAVLNFRGQLDKLVLTRYGNLTLDAQRVLRTASTIGVTFSRSVLSAVLTPQLQASLGDCLQALVTLKWVHPTIDDYQVYQFSHAHTHRLIYELTPSSERSVTHRRIAEHLEMEGGAIDPAQYATLCVHYQQCDVTKALGYAAKALEALEKVRNVFEFTDCLELLSGMCGCCRNPTEVAQLQALIKQVQIAIVMFSMDYAMRHPAPSTLLQWVGVCGGRSCRVVPDAHLHAHEHHHALDHDGEPGHDARARMCPCKVEEARDTVSHGTVTDPNDAELRGLTKEARTKKAFLRMLQEMSAQLASAAAKGA
jgi:class 3 adenylate cyclase